MKKKQNRRQSITKPDSYPALAYSVKELSLGLVETPFNMDPAEKVKTGIKLTGKSGTNIISALRALNLIKFIPRSNSRKSVGVGPIGCQEDNLQVILTDELEDELLNYKNVLLSEDTNKRKMKQNVK